MKKSKVYLIGMFIIILLAISTIASIILGTNLIGAFIIHSEKIGISELTVMLRCKNTPENNFELTVENENFTFPLPQNSSRFSNSIYNEGDGEKQFLTSTQDLTEYFKQLSDEGWIIEDRFGAKSVLKRKDTNKRISILLTRYTRYYNKLIFVNKI